MTTITASEPRSGHVMLWTGRVLSGLLVVLFVMDATMKLLVIQPVVDGSLALGWPADPTTIRTLGLVLLACTLLYAFPRTAMLGAILLTGYLGGAIATHVRVSDPMFTHTLFGVYLGVMAWGGLWLRRPDVRRLIPFAC